MISPQLTYYNMGTGVTAFSTTRQGGCSTGNYAAFNINGYCGDDEVHIAANKVALCGLLGIDSNRLVMPHQVHDCVVRRIDGPQQGVIEGVDAVMTDVPQLCIGVSTADCIPVLLYDSTHRAVSAVHAGWRGTVLRIVQKAVETMRDTYGTAPADLQAVQVSRSIVSRWAMRSMISFFLQASTCSPSVVVMLNGTSTYPCAIACN